jgi:hypothetical protein
MLLAIYLSMGGVLHVLVFNSCHREPGLKSPGIVHSFDEGYDGVLSGKYDYFYSLGGQVAWAATGKYCGKLALVGDSFFQNSVGYLLPRNSVLTNEFSRAILQLREMDKIPLSTDYAEHRDTCPPIMNPTLVRIPVSILPRRVIFAPVQYLCSSFFSGQDQCSHVSILLFGGCHLTCMQGWGMLGTFFYLAFGAEAIMFLFMLLDRKPIQGDDGPKSSEQGVPKEEEAHVTDTVTLPVCE